MSLKRPKLSMPLQHNKCLFSQLLHGSSNVVRHQTHWVLRYETISQAQSINQQDSLLQSRANPPFLDSNHLLPGTIRRRLPIPCDTATYGPAPQEISPRPYRQPTSLRRYDITLNRNYPSTRS